MNIDIFHTERYCLHTVSVEEKNRFNLIANVGWGPTEQDVAFIYH